MKNQTEEKSKHTPGPWEIVGVYFEDDKGLLAITAGSRKKTGVCLLSKYKNTSEASATAMLIAAAPDLLEACKTALASMQRYGIEQGSKEEKEVLIIEQAVAKAEGR